MIFRQLLLTATILTASAADLAFVGTTLGDTQTRAFVGGFDTNVPIHCITWRLNLLDAGTFTLDAKYGLPGKTDFNQLEEGPTIKLEGKWQRAKSDRPIYKLTSANGRTVSLIAIGENLLHFLNDDQTFKVGDAGWSYTLNRKGAGLDK
jgi:hypothetical protein